MTSIIGTNPNQVPSNSDLGSMAYLDTAQANKILSSGRRNLLHNANFEVNQRDISYPFTTPAGTPAFVCDRWKVHGNGQTTDVTVAEVTLPDGSVCNSLKTVSGLTTPNTSWLHPAQYLEFNNHYRGKTVVFSAWVRTNLPNHKFRYCDGSSCYLIGEEIPGDGEWHYAWAKTTIASTATAMNWQVFVTTSPYMESGDYLEIAQPQLEFGEYPTPYDYRPIAEELPICQRYFQSYGIGTGSSPFRIIGSGNGGSAMLTGFQFPVEMRTAPTFNYYGGSTDGGNFNVYVNAVATSNTGPTATDVNAQSVRWNFNGNGSYGSGCYWIDVGQGSSQFGWTQDAEVA